MSARPATPLDRAALDDAGLIYVGNGVAGAF